LIILPGRIVVEVRHLRAAIAAICSGVASTSSSECGGVQSDADELSERGQQLALLSSYAIL
jgi:hypothetical protein